MVTWKLIYTKQAQKDAKKINQSGLKQKTLDLLHILENNPFQNPPPYEKLLGEISKTCSRRINILYRLVYQVDEEKQLVKIIRMWTHYE